MRRQLRDSVVVVTGATSGVGRAAAHAFADEGASVVVVARDEAESETVANECRARGVDAIAVAADVSIAADVDHVVDEAVRRHGRVDTFVSAAAVLLAGHLGDERVEEIERVVATNVLGSTLCARAALRRFRQQGHGSLVLVSSLLGVVQNPLVPVYVTSKFAVRGLALSIHQDLATHPTIHVSCVLPGPVDTPMFEHAANHTGRRLRAVPPAVAPERAAAVVVACARRPRREAVVGWAGRGIVIGHRIAPRTTERAVAWASAALLTQRESAPPSEGALFSSARPGRVQGGWRRGPWRGRLGAQAARWSTRVRRAVPR